MQPLSPNFFYAANVRGNFTGVEMPLGGAENWHLKSFNEKDGF
jgi:hypothetical protein